MSIGTLADIINKVRRLTGTGTSLQLTDAQIIDYINSFYLYDFPAQFRSLKLKDKLTFNTIRGIDTYAFDSEHFTTIEMPVYCAKREIKLFQDPWSFYGVNFNWQQQENLTQGSAAIGAGPYSGTLSATPIIRSTSNNPIVQTKTQPTTSFPTGYPVTFNQAIPGRVQNILITVNISFGTTLNVTDDGAGNLIGDCLAGGTINYETGAIAGLTFTSIVPAGQNINVQYNPITMAIPLSVMFFQNQFTFRPIPDKGYTIEFIAYRQPSQALLGSTDANNPTLTGTPELIEWFETLAFGAAKKVYEDRLDPDGVALMDKGLSERYALNMTRTYAQLGKQSTNSIFRDQLSFNYGSGWGFGAGPANGG